MAHIKNMIYNNISYVIPIVKILKRDILEPVSKCFSLVKLKAGENFNHRNTWSISRIKI